MKNTYRLALLALATATSAFAQGLTTKEFQASEALEYAKYSAQTYDYGTIQKNNPGSVVFKWTEILPDYDHWYEKSPVERPGFSLFFNLLNWSPTADDPEQAPQPRWPDCERREGDEAHWMRDTRPRAGGGGQ